ncbi:hypothetical protein BST61_g2081 [Cercospora zeina]
MAKRNRAFSPFVSRETLSIPEGTQDFEDKISFRRRRLIGRRFNSGDSNQGNHQISLESTNRNPKQDKSPIQVIHTSVRRQAQ